MPTASDAPQARRRPSSWAWLVAVCACLVVGSMLTLAVWWLVSSETSVASYSVRGSVNGIELDLGGADALIVGGGDRTAVVVRRTDEYSFGRRAEAQRRAEGGVLAIRSRCPSTVLDVCDASYRLTVPDNVRVTVRTTSACLNRGGSRAASWTASIACCRARRCA